MSVRVIETLGVDEEALDEQLLKMLRGYRAAQVLLLEAREEASSLKRVTRPFVTVRKKVKQRMIDKSKVNKVKRLEAVLMEPTRARVFTKKSVNEKKTDINFPRPLGGVKLNQVTNSNAKYY